MENCDHWKHRNSTGLLQVVYDGRIWHQFTEVLTTSNVDWFQPYQHTRSSVSHQGKDFPLFTMALCFVH